MVGRVTISHHYRHYNFPLLQGQTDNDQLLLPDPLGKHLVKYYGLFKAISALCVLLVNLATIATIVRVPEVCFPSHCKNLFPDQSS